MEAYKSSFLVFNETPFTASTYISIENLKTLKDIDKKMDQVKGKVGHLTMTVSFSKIR